MWWPAAAVTARVTGDLGLAEDAVQEACLAALAQWPEQGIPANPGGWVAAVARRRAIDVQRREAARPGKERAAAADWHDQAGAGGRPALDMDDQLALIFTCCHPALDPAAQVALTLRVVCGIPTASIAAMLLVAEPTLAQRLVRAKRKIREAVIPLRMPDPAERAARLAGVLRVVYLVFTEGHFARSGSDLVNAGLCEESLRLARALHMLLRDEPEVTGLLALILLTDARRPARLDARADLVLLADQDRSLWDRSKIGEGIALLEAALAMHRPGPYQLQAAIAACHAEAASHDQTDWPQITALYGELLRWESSPVIQVNRAVAVSMSQGPPAGLEILDSLTSRPELSRWPQLQIARAGLLARAGRADEAVAAYQAALAMDPSPAECRSITARILELTSAQPAPDHQER
ncbi:MAG TPA: DUF6596 domain-containing protein [Streptosporangiaceae bacterium]